MQVMAIGTLALCYDNHRVFTGEHHSTGYVESYFALYCF